MVYTLRFFPLQNAVCFIILTYLFPVLFAFYIQGVLKLKKNSGSKRLIPKQRGNKKRTVSITPVKSSYSLFRKQDSDRFLEQNCCG